ELRHVPRDLTPATHLATVIEAAATEIVPALPLKPAARIFLVDPAFLPPHRERLRCAHAEEVERRVVALGRELRAREPACRKLRLAIGHVLSAEHTERQHLARRELWLEARLEVAARGFGEKVRVALLHVV